LRILVVEAVTSGLVDKAGSSILSEGFAMLSSIIKGLTGLGCEVSTLLAKKFTALVRYLPPVKLYKLEKPSLAELRRLAKLHDSTYVIAPEDDGLLAELLEELDGLHMCSKPEAVRSVSDKASLTLRLSKEGFRVPETVVYEPGGPLDVGCLKPPYVVKPNTGAGCVGLSIARTLEELKKAVSEAGRPVLIQEFIDGVPASVSLLTDGSNTIPLSLNRQYLDLCRRIYLGGYTPMYHELIGEAFDTASRVVSLFNGLRGYIGVDVVLSRDGVYVVEVNPRLTVSYVGLNRVLEPDPAKGIFEAGLGRLRTVEYMFNALCYFRKAFFKGPVRSGLKKLASLNEIVSPPLPVERIDEAYGVLAVVSNNFTKAKNAYLKLLNRLSLETGCEVS